MAPSCLGRDRGHHRLQEGSNRNRDEDRGRIGLLELSSTEGLDIDTHVDWALAEALLSTPKVAFRILELQSLASVMHTGL